MEQAQAAIDAARAADAPKYAEAELQGAEDALKRAYEAADQRDFRLALNNAIDARERARSAATAAGQAKERARAEASRALEDQTAALNELQARLKSAQAGRVPAGRLAAPRKAAAAVDRGLQEARTLFGQEDYASTLAKASQTSAALEALSREVDAVLKLPARRRR
jgi:hypothetical protein